MKRIMTLISFLLSATLACNAQEHAFFDGGMMLHAGYMQGHISELNYDARGVTTGMGGVLRFHLGQHLRVGGEGYVSTLNQLDNGSYIRSSWGGIVMDGYWSWGRWMPYAGLTFGGGSSSTLLLFNGSANDWTAEPDVKLHNETFLFLDPYLGVEYALTEAVHLILKADYLTPLSNNELPCGIRWYLGFIFSH